MTSNNTICWQTMTHKQWKENLQTLLLKSDAALERAIVVLYKQQPIIEQVGEEAVITDGVGFNKFDAEILDKFAKQLLYDQHSLSSKQKVLARKKIPKYWKQLMNISKKKHGWK